MSGRRHGVAWMIRLRLEWCMRAVLAHCHNCGSLPNWEAETQTSPLRTVIDEYTKTKLEYTNILHYISSNTSLV